MFGTPFLFLDGWESELRVGEYFESWSGWRFDYCATIEMSSCEGQGSPAVIVDRGDSKTLRNELNAIRYRE